MTTMDKRYNVLFLSGWYPNRTYPTMGIFIRRYALAVSAFDNVAALYICSDPSLTDRNYELVESMDENVLTVNVYYKKVRSGVPLFSSLLKLFRYQRAYRKGWDQINKKFGRPDIVHAHIVFPVGMVAWLLRRIKSIPYLITENWSGYLPSDGSYQGFLKTNLTKLIIITICIVN